MCAHLSRHGRTSGDIDNSLGDGLVVGVDAAIADDVVRGNIGDGLHAGTRHTVYVYAECKATG